MIDFISGDLVELSPTHAVIETQGMGYHIHISLHTYAKILNLKRCKLYTHLVVRADAHLLYGFENQSERRVFLLLTSVSGVGVNTARVILSSYTESEMKRIIATGDAAALETVKGIGDRTAHRILIDLKDKVSDAVTESTPGALHRCQAVDEAIAALAVLGFQQKRVKRIVEAVYDGNGDLSVEALIKQTLNSL